MSRFYNELQQWKHDLGFHWKGWVLTLVFTLGTVLILWALLGGS